MDACFARKRIMRRIINSLPRCTATFTRLTRYSLRPIAGHFTPNVPRQRRIMSLPLTRRIARTALLVAASAAPVVGAAGAASAVDPALPHTPKLGGLSAVDPPPVGELAAPASQQAGRTVKEILPAKAAPAQAAPAKPATAAKPAAEGKSAPAKSKGKGGAHAKGKGGLHAK